MQKLSAPFDVGPMRVVPYGVTDVAFFTQDNSGSSAGRLYGGAGVRQRAAVAALPRY